MILFLLGCGPDYGMLETAGHGRDACTFTARVEGDKVDVESMPLFSVTDITGYHDHASVEFSLNSLGECNAFRLHDLGFSISLSDGERTVWNADVAESTSMLELEDEPLSTIPPDRSSNGPTLRYTWRDEDVAVEAEGRRHLRYDWYGLEALDAFATLDVTHVRWTDEATGLTVSAQYGLGWTPLVFMPID